MYFRNIYADRRLVSVQYCTVQYSTVLYSAVQYSTVAKSTGIPVCTEECKDKKPRILVESIGEITETYNIAYGIVAYSFMSRYSYEYEYSNLIAFSEI